MLRNATVLIIGIVIGGLMNVALAFQFKLGEAMPNGAYPGYSKNALDMKTYIDNRLEFLEDGRISVDPAVWGDSWVTLGDALNRLRAKSDASEIKLAVDPATFGKSYISLTELADAVGSAIDSTDAEAFTSTYWDTSTPASQWDAINRIANHVKTGGTGSIDVEP